MALFVITSSKDIIFLYAKLYLAISIFDACMFWLYGHSFSNIYAWIIFSLFLARVGIAFILYKGVPQRNMFKCKTFCITEVILIFLQTLSLSIQILTPGHVIWFIIVCALRLYGVWTIGGFIRKVQFELGNGTYFPWTIFPEPVDSQNKEGVAEIPTASPI